MEGPAQLCLDHQLETKASSRESYEVYERGWIIRPDLYFRDWARGVPCGWVGDGERMRHYMFDRHASRAIRRTETAALSKIVTM